MHDSIFREYDIRGKIDSEFVIEQTYDLTRAIITYFLQKNPAVKTVVVGRDGRISSPAIQEQMIQALTHHGINVIDIGICPSPVLYFALHKLPVQAGLMITASHNPKEYNGIKICLGHEAVWGKEIGAIKKIYQTKQFLPLSSLVGTVTEHALIPEYINWMVEHFPRLKGMGLHAIIDSGNGAGGTVLTELVKKFEWKQVTLQCIEVDGNYPHHEADPTVEKNMVDVKHALATTHASVGIGLDGDCDRMAAMTKSGFLVPGDQLLAVFAQEVLNHYPGAGVVFDVKASSALIELLDRWGARGYMSACGHSIVKELMHKQGALLGGELSCHFFFDDRYLGYDDGIYAMLRLFEILVVTGKSLDELIKIFPKRYSSPEIRLACPEERKREIVEYLEKIYQKNSDADVNTIDGIRVTLPYAWTSIRASNTQPALSIRFESDTQEGLLRLKKEVIELLKPFFEEAVLHEKFEI